MLGIWEYFWDVLDWTGAPVIPANIIQVTATVSEINENTATTAQLNTNTGTV